MQSLESLLSDTLFHRFIFKRERSSSEILQYLQKHHPHLDAIAILKELIHRKLIDDRKFAENRVYYRTHISHWGDDKIHAELHFLGIDETVIKECLGEVLDEIWLQSAIKVVKPLLGKEINKDELKKKASQKLLNRGFSEELSLKLLKAIL